MGDAEGTSSTPVVGLRTVGRHEGSSQGGVEIPGLPGHLPGLVSGVPHSLSCTPVAHSNLKASLNDLAQNLGMSGLADVRQSVHKG